MGMFGRSFPASKVAVPDPFLDPHVPLRYSGGMVRYCEEKETHELDTDKAVSRNICSFLLFVIGMFYLYLTLQEGDVEFGERFICSDVNQTEDGTLLSDADVKVLCWFRTITTVISMLMFVPYLWHEISLSMILLLSGINKDVKVPISGGVYSGEDKYFSQGLSAEWGRIFSVCAGIIYICCYIDRDHQVTKQHKCCRIGNQCYAFFSYIICNILLAISMFPLAFFVMLGQNNAQGVFLTFVGLQIYMRVADTLINMYSEPRKALGGTLQNYIVLSSKATKPIYYPIQEYDRTNLQNYLGANVDNEKVF